MLDFTKLSAVSKRTRVELGEAGDLWFRSMSARQRVELFDAFRDRLGSKTGADNLEFQLAVIRATACDESGALIVGEAEVEQLRDADQAVFARIADAAMAVAGFREDPQKNSSAPPSDASPSV